MSGSSASSSASQRPEREYSLISEHLRYVNHITRGAKREESASSSSPPTSSARAAKAKSSASPSSDSNAAASSSTTASSSSAPSLAELQAKAERARQLRASANAGQPRRATPIIMPTPSFGRPRVKKEEAGDEGSSSSASSRSSQPSPAPPMRFRTVKLERAPDPTPEVAAPQAPVRPSSSSTSTMATSSQNTSQHPSQPHSHAQEVVTATGSGRPAADQNQAPASASTSSAAAPAPASSSASPASSASTRQAPTTAATPQLPSGTGSRASAIDPPQIASPFIAPGAAPSSSASVSGGPQQQTSMHTAGLQRPNGSPDGSSASVQAHVPPPLIFAGHAWKMSSQAAPLPSTAAMTQPATPVSPLGAVVQSPLPAASPMITPLSPAFGFQQNTSPIAFRDLAPRAATNAASAGQDASHSLLVQSLSPRIASSAAPTTNGMASAPGNLAADWASRAQGSPPSPRVSAVVQAAAQMHTSTSWPEQVQLALHATEERAARNKQETDTELRGKLQTLKRTAGSCIAAINAMDNNDVRTVLLRRTVDLTREHEEILASANRATQRETESMREIAAEHLQRAVSEGTLMQTIIRLQQSELSTVQRQSTRTARRIDLAIGDWTMLASEAKNEIDLAAAASQAQASGSVATQAAPSVAAAPALAPQQGSVSTSPLLAPSAAAIGRLRVLGFSIQQSEQQPDPSAPTSVASEPPLALVVHLPAEGAEQEDDSDDDMPLAQVLQRGGAKSKPREEDAGTPIVSDDQSSVLGGSTAPEPAPSTSSSSATEDMPPLRRTKRPISQRILAPSDDEAGSSSGDDDDDDLPVGRSNKRQRVHPVNTYLSSATPEPARNALVHPAAANGNAAQEPSNESSDAVSADVMTPEGAVKAMFESSTSTAARPTAQPAQPARGLPPADVLKVLEKIRPDMGDARVRAVAMELASWLSDSIEGGWEWTDGQRSNFLSTLRRRGFPDFYRAWLDTDSAIRSLQGWMNDLFERDVHSTGDAATNGNGGGVRWLKFAQALHPVLSILPFTEADFAKELGTSLSLGETVNALRSKKRTPYHSRKFWFCVAPAIHADFGCPSQ